MIFSVSQKIESVTLIALIIMYFAAADSSIATMFLLGTIVAGCILMIGNTIFTKI